MQNKKLKIFLLLSLFTSTIFPIFSQRNNLRTKIVGDLVEVGSGVIPLAGMIFSYLLSDSSLTFENAKEFSLPVVLIIKGICDYANHINQYTGASTRLPSRNMYLFKKTANVVELYVALRAIRILYREHCNYCNKKLNTLTVPPITSDEQRVEMGTLKNYLEHMALYTVPTAVAIFTLLAKGTAGIVFA